MILLGILEEGSTSHVPLHAIRSSQTTADKVVNCRQSQHKPHIRYSREPQHSYPYPRAQLLITHLPSPLICFAQPLEALNRIRSDIPIPRWLDKARDISSQYRTFSTSNPTLDMYAPAIQRESELAYVPPLFYPSSSYRLLNSCEIYLFHHTKLYITLSGVF